MVFDFYLFNIEEAGANDLKKNHNNALRPGAKCFGGQKNHLIIK